MKWRSTKRTRGWVKADEAKRLGQERDREDERRMIEEGLVERESEMYEEGADDVDWLGW